MFYVAVHEFGHALGLGHSKNTTSVMFPYAGMYDPSFRLHSDDIQGIQVLQRKYSMIYSSLISI